MFLEQLQVNHSVGPTYVTPLSTAAALMAPVQAETLVTNG